MQTTSQPERGAVAALATKVLVATPFGLLAGVVVAEVFDLSVVLGLVSGVLLAAVVVFSFGSPAFAVSCIALFGTLNVEFGGAGLTVGTSEVALLLTAPAFLRFYLRRRSSAPMAVRLGVALLLVGNAVAMIVNAGAGPDVMWGWLRWNLVVVAILGLAAEFVWAPQALLRRSQLSLMGAGVLAAAMGAAQLAGFTRFVGVPALVGRPDATFNWYSNYTNFLSIAVLVSLGILISRHYGVAVRGLAAAAALFMSSQIVVGLSRGAILCLIGGFAFLSLATLRSAKRWPVVAALGLLMVALAIAVAPSDSLATLTGRLTTAQGEDSYRGSLQVAGLAAVIREPLGLGLGEFEGYLRAEGGLGALAVLAHPHFLLLAVAVEVGVIGAVGFAMVVLGALAGWLRCEWRVGGAFTPDLGAAMALSGIVAQGAVDYFFYETASMVAFAVVLAATVSRAWRGRSPSLSLNGVRD